MSTPTEPLTPTLVMALRPDGSIVSADVRCTPESIQSYKDTTAAVGDWAFLAVPLATVVQMHKLLALAAALLESGVTDADWQVREAFALLAEINQHLNACDDSRANPATAKEATA